ncbi:MAG: hemolysin family protein [Prevotellaceae bacterium]|nr:hemolysin family protein [Prevotellaceae bacterium]MDO4932140.1 hemolysin family protein [Prevotellaceae bacterium]
MLFSAFFSGMEIAYVSSNRMLAEMTGDNNSLSHRIVSFFYKHPNTFVSTMLVGNNIALVIYGILIAKLFDSTIFYGMSEAFTVTADTIISTIIVLFTGEFLPKTIFKNNANTLLSLFALPASICYFILFPISRLCTSISKIMLKSLGVDVSKEEPKEEFSKVDLDFLVQQSIDKADNEEDIQEEVRIFQNALDLSDTKVRDCMIPRTEINAVDRNTPLDDLRQRFIESGRSKIIVYNDDIDHIIGYIHSSEMFSIKSEWQSHIRQMQFVPETMAARKLMQNMLMQKTNLAVVVDEFGGTSGIVALEDIVEEIIGEIEDEHDTTNYECRRTSDGGYLISARMEIERVNDILNINLPESDDYKTISGFILDRYQSFPKLNEVIVIDDWKCKILKTTQTKIELVKFTKRGQEQ